MKKKILVVDDNQMMLKFFANILERAGHQVAVAEDGFSALIKLTSFTPDILFVDLIMPKIGGDMLCKIVRKMHHLDNCYLVVISAAVSEMKLDYSEIGVNACIAKGPFGTMAEHILQAVKESDSPGIAEKPKTIAGTNDLYDRQIVKELLSRKHHLETILESIDEGILEIFSERIVNANSAAVSLFGIPEENLLGSFLPDLFSKSVGLKVEKLLQSKTGKPVEIGYSTPVELNGRQVIIKNLPMKGEESTSILFITDVSERRKLELQLQHAQKMEAIGTIASGVAHNFRNTLAGIMFNSQLIQMDHKDEPTLYEIAERINACVRRGSQLVDSLVQFARKQTKKELHSIDLSAVIFDIYQLTRKSFDKKILIHIEANKPLPIMGEYLGLSQALMNLCNNARDAMPEGGELTIKASKEGSKAVVIISDTGSGMDTETIEKCFDPFFTKKGIGKGTGLGLSTTYGIVKSYDGEIHIQSEPNKGSVFTLSFPLASSMEPDKHKNKPGIKLGNGEKVLVVDDEPEFLNATSDLLTALGYRVDTISRPNEVLDRYKTWEPDIVLMDRNMPEMDGIACADEITKYDPDAIIAVLSGYEEFGPESISDEKRGLIKGYLTKPIDIVELSVLLTRLIKARP
ncbi:MAG: response regulator [Deltaproteobacteria bacterium]|nr:response regulator [Deltaproteobacteria bacterium]MBW1907971.1 response regulator [Deltaproteobacteria bacterium]MBW2034182.1 response regulator [Deltaproteobacteria bacterium]